MAWRAISEGGGFDGMAKRKLKASLKNNGRERREDVNRKRRNQPGENEDVSGGAGEAEGRRKYSKRGGGDRRAAAKK
jgi:hypothetical protein